MSKIGRDTAALLLAAFIVIKTAFNILFPEIQLRETVEIFFYRQMDILSVMGSNLAKEGGVAAASTIFSHQSPDELYPVYAENRAISEGERQHN